MTDNALAPLSDIQSKLRDRVQAAMLDLIPPAVLDQFIKKAWEQLTTDRPAVMSRYDSQRVETPEQPSELSAMIKGYMRTALKEHIAAWAEEWKKGPDASPIAREILTVHTELAAKNFLASVSASIVQQAANDLIKTLNFGTCNNCCSAGTRNTPCRCGGTYY